MRGKHHELGERGQLPTAKAVGLQLTREGCRVWPVDDGPASDVARRDVISGAGKTATDTGENRLTRAITLIDTSTRGAGTGCIPRVNQDYGYTGKGGLVHGLLAKIVERPGMVQSPLSLTDRYPLPNALKVLQGNTARGVFSSLHQSLADTVVNVGGKALFLASSHLKQTLSRLSALALQSSSKLGVTMPKTVDLAAGVRVPVAIYCNVLNAKIDAKKILNVGGLRHLDITSGKQVELTINVAEVGLPTLPLQKLALTGTADKGNTLPTIYRPDGDLRLVNIPSENAAIKGNGSKRGKYPLSVVIYLISIGNLGNATHDELRCQGKRFTNGVVGELMERKLSEGVVLPRLLTDVVASGVSGFKGALEHIRLFRCRGKLNLGCQLHNPIIPQVINKLKGGAQSLPRLKPVGFLAPCL